MSCILDLLPTTRSYYLVVLTDFTFLYCITNSLLRTTHQTRIKSPNRKKKKGPIGPIDLEFSIARPLIQYHSINSTSQHQSTDGPPFPRYYPTATDTAIVPEPTRLSSIKALFALSTNSRCHCSYKDLHSIDTSFSCGCATICSLPTSACTELY